MNAKEVAAGALVACALCVLFVRLLGSSDHELSSTASPGFGPPPARSFGGSSSGTVADEPSSTRIEARESTPLPPPDPKALLEDPRATRKALLANEIRRGDVEEGLYLRLQELAAKDLLTEVSQEQQEAFFEKFTTPAPVSSLLYGASEKELEDVDRERLAAIDAAYRPLLEGAVERAIAAYKDSLGRCWDGGGFSSWPEGSAEPALDTGDTRTAIRATSRTTVQGTCFRFTYNSGLFPEVEAAFAEIHEIQRALTDEKRAYLRAGR
ncbi:MAG: hypothetical protein AB1726_13770 [Planctomycetota bacterium]